MHADTARVNVFKVSGPVYKEPWDIFGVELEVPSDLNGTIELEAVTLLHCPLLLSDVKVPVACWQDPLWEHGFVEVRGRCVYVPDGFRRSTAETELSVSQIAHVVSLVIAFVRADS